MNNRAGTRARPSAGRADGGLRLVRRVFNGTAAALDRGCCRRHRVFCCMIRRPPPRRSDRAALQGAGACPASEVGAHAADFVLCPGAAGLAPDSHLGRIGGGRGFCRRGWARRAAPGVGPRLDHLGGITDGHGGSLASVPGQRAGPARPVQRRRGARGGHPDRCRAGALAAVRRGRTAQNTLRCSRSRCWSCT